MKKKKQQIESELEKAKKRYDQQKRDLQTGCKHKNTDRWSDYEGINEQCLDCGYWLR